MHVRELAGDFEKTVGYALRLKTFSSVGKRQLLTQMKRSRARGFPTRTFVRNHNKREGTHAMGLAGVEAHRAGLPAPVRLLAPASPSGDDDDDEEQIGGESMSVGANGVGVGVRSRLDA